MCAHVHAHVCVCVYVCQCVFVYVSVCVCGTHLLQFDDDIHMPHDRVILTMYSSSLSFRASWHPLAWACPSDTTAGPAPFAGPFDPSMMIGSAIGNAQIVVFAHVAGAHTLNRDTGPRREHSSTTSD